MQMFFKFIEYPWKNTDFLNRPKTTAMQINFIYARGCTLDS